MRVARAERRPLTEKKTPPFALTRVLATSIVWRLSCRFRRVERQLDREEAMSQSGRAAWSVITATAVAFSLWSLTQQADGQLGVGCCVVNGTTCTVTGLGDCEFGLNGTYQDGLVCNENNTGCREPLPGCCDNGNGTCFSEESNELDCALTNLSLIHISEPTRPY